MPPYVASLDTPCSIHAPSTGSRVHPADVGSPWRGPGL